MFSAAAGFSTPLQLETQFGTNLHKVSIGRDLEALESVKLVTCYHV